MSKNDSDGLFELTITFGSQFRTQTEAIKHECKISSWVELFSTAIHLLYIAVFSIKEGKSLAVYDMKTMVVEPIKMPAFDQIERLNKMNSGPALTLVTDNTKKD